MMRAVLLPPAVLAVLILALAVILLLVQRREARAANPAQASEDLDRDVVRLWARVPAPEPPPVQAVRVDPGATALLVLDLEHKTCNAERRPRCVAAAPRLAVFLERCRAAGLFVAHSVVRGADASDILPGLTPRPGEPVVSSGVDKFFRTDLEDILTARGVRAVIVIGTAANGAVLHTATGAALRGLQVIVPVDGMSGDLYAEQYTAWHLLNAPGTRSAAILTRTELVDF